MEAVAYINLHKFYKQEPLKCNDVIKNATWLSLQFSYFLKDVMNFRIHAKSYNRCLTGSGFILELDTFYPLDYLMSKNPDWY